MLRPSRDFLKMVAVTIIVAVVFGLFLLVAGIPATKARNLYNVAMSLPRNETTKAERTRLLTESLNNWYSMEADIQLSKVGL